MSAPVLERQKLTDAVAKRIKHALVDKDMNQADLARALGKDEVWLSRRLKGHVVLDILELAEIAAVLDVSAANLLAKRAPETTDWYSPSAEQRTRDEVRHTPPPNGGRRVFPIGRGIPQTAEVSPAAFGFMPSQTKPFAAMPATLK